MKSVTIGIYLQSDADRLRATLASVQRNTTGCSYELLLLPDGPDAQIKRVLRELSYPQSATDEPRGVGACFNRLISSVSADLVVLLESGCLVGPDWLRHLQRALASDPQNGLAGPSTNLCWNEQGAYPRCGNTWKEIDAVAKDAARRYRNQARTLEPLYSLADFCYAARREVIATIGAASEQYGTGPCWEMDYNVRAARAGWRSVWAGAAFVYRSPWPASRHQVEARGFEKSKRRYQDNFCGRLLRGEKTAYRAHCEGDACPNFAPAAAIQIRRPLSVVENTIASIISVTEISEPLVTCIMPTYNRRCFIPQAMRCFLKQNYNNKELLIIDDGEQEIDDCIPIDERVRYLRLANKLTIGAKRNLACENARGEFIAHFDDDDWYPQNRISEQVQALQGSGADVCGSSRIYFQEAAANNAWEYRYGNKGKTWVAGSTLFYRKNFWQRNRFQDIQIGEDARFVWNEATVAVLDLANPALCVATVHQRNTSKKNVSGAFWHPVEFKIVRDLLRDELNFYRAVGESNLPLVSCIMPTYNRRAFVPQALEHFKAQDYPHKELIIVDDGEESVADLVGRAPDVSYLRLNRRHTVGAKRNLACRRARGEIIALWDDDDWYSTDRLRYQIAPILAGEADMTGLKDTIFAELATGDFWKLEARLHERMFFGNIPGGTLVFHRNLLTKGLVFPEINLGEDTGFLRQAMNSGFRLHQLANPEVFIYFRHNKNTWRGWQPGKFLEPDNWLQIQPPALFTRLRNSSF